MNYFLFLKDENNNFLIQEIIIYYRLRGMQRGMSLYDFIISLSTQLLVPLMS